MCSISGFLVTDPEADLGRIAAWYALVLERSAERGRDSAGVVTLDRQGLARRVVSLAPRRYDFIHQAIAPGCTLLIANNRAEPTTEYVRAKTEADTQPFGDGTVYITHNGTIANDGDLRSRFGIQTNTAVDSAVIAPLIGQLGIDAALSHLKGSFALAVADARHPHRLWLARNYKPLYLQRRPDLGALFFASRPDYVADGHTVGQQLTQPAIVSLPPYHLAALDGRTGAVEVRPLEARAAARRALIICSGGLDSVTAAKWAQRAGYEITLLHFLYRCRAEEREVAAVRAVATALGCDYRLEPLDWLGNLGGSSLTDPSLPITDNQTGAEFAHEWVPARNLIFCALAAALCDRLGYDTIILGLNLEEGGAYPDNTVEFYQTLDHVCNIGTVSRPVIISPLANLVKHEIVKLALELDAPIDLAWSCYYGGECHCGHCGPCFMRRTAFQMLGFVDPIRYEYEP